jgi:NAD(P)-dependent dehydrogenase (short-subunit alcohol dehydrogenase family)
MSKVALVTGGSRGIGNAIALDLLKKGYRVGIGYHKNRCFIC